MDSIEKWVWFYYYQGLVPIPLKRTDPPSEENKKPNINSWRKYQDEYPSEEDVKIWLKEGKYQNIGVICGIISNSLVVIDFDDETLFNDLELKPEELIKKGHWVVKTGKKGRYHVYCKCKDSPGDVKKDINIHLERRGNGGYVVAPLSIHPNGNKYQFFNNDTPENLKELNSVDFEIIWKELIEKAYKIKGIEKKKTKKIIKEGKQKLTGTHPECIKNILKGVKKGSRNDTAFVLTQYFIHWKNLDSEKAKEIVGSWNKRNEPILPWNELNSVMESAIKSDKQIGCTKLTQVSNCPYTDKKECKWLKQEAKQKTFFVSTKNLGNIHLEEILENDIPKFVVYDKEKNTWTIEEEVIHDGIIYRPLFVSPKQKKSLILPDGIEEYNTLADFRKEMLDFALEEYDPVDKKDDYKLIINILLTSWISPIWQENMAEKFIPIINPRGPSETGKKRFLTVVRWLTYHSIYSLKTNRVPTLFRTIDPWQGTLILDEADMNDSSTNNELVEFLNSRADGVPISRYGTESKKVDWFYSFGLSSLATRQGFTDDGLESRCLVMPTTTTDNPGKYNLIPPNEWLEKGKRLQRKLLLFKLRHLNGSMPTQLLIPNISSFRVRESLLILQGLREEDPSLMKGINELAKKLEERIIKERSASPEGLILNVVYGHLTDNETILENWRNSYIIVKETRKKDDTGEYKTNRYPLTLKSISKSLGESFSSSDIARFWRGFHQDTVSQKRIDERKFRGVLQILNIERLDKIFPKYVFDYETPSIMKIEMDHLKQVQLDEGCK